MRFDFEDCGGCKTCQLACAYKLTGDFGYRSAIAVIEKPEKNGYIVELKGADCNDQYSCDGCKNHEEPYCVMYCHQRDKLMQCIGQFTAHESGCMEGEAHA